MRTARINPRCLAEARQQQILALGNWSSDHDIVPEARYHGRHQLVPQERCLGRVGRLQMIEAILQMESDGRCVHCWGRHRTDSGRIIVAWQVPNLDQIPPCRACVVRDGLIISGMLIHCRQLDMSLM
eukprot:scaffold209701_cov46-Prasinocladus_malaysianus.AAC.1